MKLRSSTSFYVKRQDGALKYCLELLKKGFYVPCSVDPPGYSLLLLCTFVQPLLRY